jgi:Zn-dependent M28 family amino/carboxypeptidase
MSYQTLFIISTLLIIGCSSEPQQKTKAILKPKVKIEVPTFNADSAYAFVAKQVSFGPRVISSKGWENCAIWLEKKFKTYTSTVIVQQAPINTYDGKNHTLKNIIASFSPEKNNRVALFAHWDSRHIADHDTKNQNEPILGANDGGSGVGVLIELARQFSIKNPKIGVDIILFDAEDYGQPENSGFPVMQDSWCLGSQYWSNNPHKPNYFAQYGILLDMVGAKEATFRHEQISFYYASNILQKVWRKASRLGFGNHFVFESANQILDDHYYVNTITGIPTIDIIEYDPATESNFNKHWHTHKDDMDNIDKSTLNAVGQTLLEVIYTE